jgi:hypothetical protein
MEKYCSTGQSPQQVVAPKEEEEEEEEPKRVLSVASLKFSGWPGYTGYDLCTFILMSG